MGKPIRVALLIATLLACTNVLAQVEYSEDFQSYPSPGNPPGWVDTAIGNAQPEADGLYKTWPDPLQNANLVFGTKQSSGKPEGNNPRNGTFSTLKTKTFATSGRFEYRGRFLRTDNDTHIGLSFLSSYPETDRYYLIGTWSNDLTMQLFGFGAGSLTGTTNSAFTPDAGKWVRFLIQVDDIDSATRIRARLWLDGTTEPSTYSIDAVDASSSRLTSGRIGIWSAVKGGAYVDDLYAKSPVDHTAPVITFFEGTAQLQPNTITAIDHDARIDVRATDDLSGIASITATLLTNGVVQPYTLLSPITAEGPHTIHARAADNAGNASESETQVLIDKTPPVVSITESGQPLQSNAAFNRNVRPEITINDLTQTSVSATLLVNGTAQPYAFGTEITVEGRYVLIATATDELGWTTTTPEIVFFVDRTAPSVVLMEGDNALTDGLAFNRDVTPRVVITDATTTTATATLNDQPFTLGTAIAAEGVYRLVVKVTDAVGLLTELPVVTFTIDKTPPAIVFTDPIANAVLTLPRMIVVGNADDAVTIKVNGIDATIDAALKTFATPVAIEMLEGENTITAIGIDHAGNTSTSAITVRLDTRAPELTITSPAANACVDATEVQVAGKVSDPALAEVRVSGVVATLSADRRSFTASVPTPAEGKIVLRVEAIDASGHASTATIPVTIDRTKPVLEVSEGGAAFNATILSRPIALSLRANETATMVITLDGQPYANGAVISAEGAHELRAKATDCAGHVSDELVRQFTIDRTQPSIASITPANGAVVGNKPAITGTLSETATVLEERSARTAVVNGTSFTLEGVLEEGVNALALVLTDAAGNQTRIAHSVMVDTSAPSIEIVENGESIPPSALFHRPVTPVIRTNEREATIIATNNGVPFTSGTTISADGEYTITAKVRDAIGNESREATATFRIDRTAPSIAITSPAAGAILEAETVEVRGTISGSDIESVRVNDVVATLTGGAFVANVPLEVGPNTITAIATDHAKNVASATVDVQRGRGPIGLLLTAPPDNLLTNRPSIVVAGQVLTPSAAQKLTINGVETPLDPAGGFRRNDFALTEGENVITASVTSTTGAANSATVKVNADFTAPVLHVLANGIALSDGARFAAAPAIALEITDNSTTPIIKTLTVDGELVSEGVLTLAQGGHALTATARDAAGNESRVDRVFFIGDAATVSGCALGNFEPADGTSVFSEVVRITGRAGGAAGVLINGNAASVADGSFCGDATLAAGRNEVTIQCADASGQPTSDAPVKLVLFRYADPTITITLPTSQSIITATKVTVTGTVSEGVTSGDVNGIAFTVPEGAQTFTVADVPVTPGLNVLIARAKTSSARGAAASVHVRVARAAPQIAITSPLSGSETGSLSVDVSGTYANADPSAITVNGSAATTRAWSDTSGTFTIANVPLTPASTTRITAAAGSASASIDVRHVATAPTIAITAPADNTYLASTHSGPVHVTGTFSGDGGTQVQINGSYATIADGVFSADVEIAAGIQPIVARAITPDGRSATDSLRVIRLGAPLTIKETFPAADANAVDPGIAIVLLFSNPIDKTSVAGAVRVSDAAGAEIAGETFVDRDAITFAPAQPLRSGQRYTVAIASSLKDVAGASLSDAQSFAFTVAATASANAPTLDEATTTGCFSGTTITGRVATPGARVRLDVDGVTMTTTSSDTGAFKFTFTFSGQTGYHLVRVREIGSDGTLSAERAVCFSLNCAIPQVVSASLDRAAKKITIQFSKPMDAASLDAAIVVAPLLDRTVTLANDIATVTLASVPDETITLTVKKSAKDTTGASMAADFTQSFAFQTDPTAGHGDGYINGAIYDATNGRPLEGATIAFLNPQSSILHSDHRGHYARSLPEGAYTIQASAPGYTTIWRQVVVKAGAGVVPIDIRLTKQNAENALSHGGDTKITKRVELASAPSGRTIRLTSVGQQSLAGLLPLGWSPLAAAEIVSDDPSLPGAKLTFVIDAAAVTAAVQTLSLVQYDSERDEWRVIVAAANVPSDGRVPFDITSAGNYALVYPDDGAPVARTGATLAGVENPCVTTPDVCKVTGRSFVLEPKAVLPSGRTVATLTVDGTKPYPSGTAVQAFIDEQLNLADGRVLVDPPFATDLLIYRTLAGDAGVADFHLAPSAQATGVILRDGVDHIRVVDYPGRIDRGTLIGAEGGRVPGDDSVSIDIPAGATSEPLHASVASISDLTQFGPIAGFQIAAGFTFTLARTNEPQLPEGVTASGVELLTPARATVSISPTTSQVVIAEILSSSSFGVLYRLAALTSPTSFAGVFATRAIDSTQLPLDGIVRDGRYLVLVADAPIAYAYGQVRSGIAIANARVSAPPLGVRDLTRIDGLFAIPVPAKPAPPFTLVPRSTALGDGATYTSPSSPDADTFVNAGVLPLVAQPPRLVSVTPADGAVVDAGAVVIQATFDVSIDAASLPDAVRLTNLNAGSAVAGSTSANGPTTIRFTPAAPLSAGTRYSISIAPIIRSATGTPFGRTALSQFTTRALPSNTTIRPDLVSITIPDANGKSTITGRPGALPSGATAVAVRRGVFFIESYQSVVAADGSFTFDAGHLHANDRITTNDTIDLQVLDPVSRAIIAMIELTPFVSSDGKGFIAREDRETRFLSIDNIRVIVPAGAFEAPTMVAVKPSTKDAFADVPNFDAELGFGAAIEITFDGVAKKPLDVEMPVPAGLNVAGRDWLLAWLGDSARGPRVAIADVVYVDGTTFKTGLAPNTNGARRVSTNAALVDDEMRRYMMRLRRQGIYATVDLQMPGIRVAAGFMSSSFLQGLQFGVDLFWNWMASAYAPYQYVVDGEDKIVIPVPLDRPFTIVGVDAGTGLDAFTKVYNPIPPGTPSVDLPSPDTDRVGPHPVFGTPFRIETMDVDVEDIDLTAISNFTVKLKNGSVTAETTLEPEIYVTLLNVTNGAFSNRAGGLSVRGAIGDRIVLFIGQKDVDPYSELSIVFNEPLSVSDEALKSVIRVEMRAEGAEAFAQIGDALRFSTNSNGRRVVIETPASLARGAEYRIAISKDLADRSGLKIGEVRDANDNVSGGLSDDLYLYFRVREPGDKRASFDLNLTCLDPEYKEVPCGVIRDQALNGNVLLVSAFDGGIVAYDVANPAGMGPNTVPLGRAPSETMAYWGIATDHHGRIYATGVGNLFTAIRSFRLEDFLPGASGDRSNVPIRGAGIVSWVPGASFQLALDSRVIAGDRPEAIPRKIQILVQDDTKEHESLAEFKAATAATTTSTKDDLEVLTAEFGRQSEYATQRITVENTTLDMRWSADARGSTPARITGIVARSGDTLRVIRNTHTYAVVALFGYGIGVYDLNAIENNDAPEKATMLKELIHLTDGKLPIKGEEDNDPKDEDEEKIKPCDPLPVDAIPDLTYTPDATIVTRPDSSKLYVMALDATRGVLDLEIDPALAETRDCHARGRKGLRFRNALYPESDHPRLKKLRELFSATAPDGREPRPRFTGAARYRWTLKANDNRAGQRGSLAGTNVTRDYMLIPGNEYGLLIVEIGGDPGPFTIPFYWNLNPHHLVDVIWIPHGAYAVRTIPGRDLATVVDGEGHVLLVDLKRIDERWGIEPDALFPTVASVLAKGIDTPDPRIVWRSQEPLAQGTLAPVVDPDTGYVYVGKLLEKTTNIVAAVDPQLKIQARVDQAKGLSSITGIVPLGIDPPNDITLTGENASLAAFRLELALPGALNESIGSEFKVKLESEYAVGAKALDTPAGWPRAHQEITMQRAVPASMTELRYQRGYNKWFSPWIVGVADIRASEKWQWSANTSIEEKAAQGCAKCERPPALKDKSDVVELYTTGRAVAIRPDPSVFNNTPYAYLSKNLVTHTATVPADTLRPREVQIAAHNPPVAGGALQETTYVHSGEIETSNIDLDAGGRAGFNVVVDRTYRSRTIGGTAFGAGWDSMLFRRLRPLPNGDVEYRDGAGEVWLFKSGYATTIGLYLKLTRTSYGWVLVDTQRREMRFDTLGRLIAETDHLYDKDGGGNITRYLYNDKTQLSRVIDPVGRETFFKYNEQGFVEEITDWRGPKAPTLPGEPGWQGRKVTYAYQDGCLTEVKLPEAKAGEGVPAEFDHSGAKRPRIAYSYDVGVGSGFNDTVELKTNLKSITDPAGESARVTFNYTSPKRDRVADQMWPGGVSATFTYEGALTRVVDALGQNRTYTFAEEGPDKRQHIQGITVDVDYVDVAALPVEAPPVVTTKREALTTLMQYTGDGQVHKVFHPNGLNVESIYERTTNGAPGKILKKIIESAPGFTAETQFAHETSSNQVEKIGRSEGGSGLEERDTPQVTRETKKTVVTDEGVSITTNYNSSGQATDVVQTEAGSETPVISAKTIYYAEDSVPLARSRPFFVHRGEGERENFGYALTADGGEQVETHDMVRGTRTKTTLDSFGRVVRRVLTDTSGEVLANERYGYDASGRLAYSARTQKGAGTIETRTKYDALGRETETTMTRAAVNGSSATIKTATTYDFANRTITEVDPTSEGSETVPAEQVTTLDKLGRPVEIVRRGATAQTVTRRFAYDKTGVRVYESDGVRTAVLSKQDVLGRTVATVASDGTKTETKYSQWSEPQEITSFDVNGEMIAQTENGFTARGRIKSTSEAIGETARKTLMSWRDGGKREVTRVGETGAVDFLTGRVRARQVMRDDAGHVTEERIGELPAPEAFVFDPESTTETWALVSRQFNGNVPIIVRASEPKAGSEVATTAIINYDGLDRPVDQTLAFEHVTKTTYDESGNVLTVTRPGMNTETATYDSRGLVTKRTMADGKTNEYRYNAFGNVREVIDETGESTSYEYDALERLRKITYADGTTEETTYEDKTGAVKATRDRAGQWLSYSYDDGGRIVGVHKGEEPTPEALLIKYEYDLSGRLRFVSNKDAAIGYFQYDLLGRPGITSTWRYRGGTGLKSDAEIEVLDAHTQRHTWSVHDERASWGMPVAGAVEPDPQSKWLQTIVETRDAGSNLVGQAKSTTGGELSSANVRSLGRLFDRKQHLASGATITTAYGFADGKDLPGSIELPPLVVGSTQAETGLPLWSATSVGSTRLAGSANARDDALRLQSLLDLGTKRISAWSYDDRGRLGDAWLGVASALASPTSNDTLIDADFRSVRSARAALTPSQHETLGAEAAKIEPLTWSATRADAHQIDARTLTLDEIVQSTRDYAFAGGRRTNDGVWSFTFDELGRMTSAEKADRRIAFSWDPNDRLVGRVAYEPDGAGGWRLETRTNVLARDGLPAETTFVWDPIVDRLVAVFQQGASRQSDGPLEPTAGLLRQYLHGDQGVDDPTRVLVAQSDGDPATFFPVVDEMGAGSLAAVIDENGNLVERVLYADSYGDAPKYLHGAVADKISLDLTKDNAGNVESVKVRVHLSERVDATTLATGARLASVKETKTLAQLSTVAPELEDDFTILWTLPATEWNLLANATDAKSLEVSLTNALRVKGWGATPVVPVPAWARKIYSGVDAASAQPVIYRESLSSISSREGARNVYEIEALYLAASEESKAKLFFDFKAWPLREPATNLIFARSRFYDSATGEFLTPDPYGAIDSNNLYAGLARDPVNNSDPLGAFGQNAVERQLMYWFAEKYATDEGFRNNVDDVTYAVGETLANPYVQGTLQLVGGCGEAIAGGSVVWTGAGTLPGAVMLAHGGDICFAGARTILTGKVHESFFDQGSMYALQKAGMSEQNARIATGVANIGIGAVSAIGATRGLQQAAARDAARSAQRARVLANLTASAEARAASRFPSVTATTEELADITARAARITDRLIRNNSTYWASVYNNPALRGQRFAQAFAQKPQFARSLIRGNIMDDVVKQLAAKAELPFLRITPRGARGADFINLFLESGWDVTTAGSWARHVSRYANEPYDLYPLIY